MKKYIYIIALIVVLLTVFLAYYVLNRVQIEDTDEVRVVFSYYDRNIDELLSYEEATIVSNIFNGKFLYSDNPICGFTENVSIRIGDSQTFCVACDSCQVVFLKERNMYFSISKEEQEVLFGILEKHEFVFPCI